MSGYLDGKRQVALYNTYTKSQADDLFPLKVNTPSLTGGSEADFIVMPQVGGDPIVESGSNADGEWTRWADGTQTSSFKDGVVGVTEGNPRVWTFPIAFIEEPKIMGSVLWSNAAATTRTLQTDDGAPTAVSVNYRVANADGSSNGAIGVLIAQGRWK